MDVFVWNPIFETGIELVDAQHKRLVTIINRLGTTLITGAVEPAAIEATYRELAAYAQKHFADEERLMEAAAMPAQYIEHHRSQHRAFVDQLGSLWQRRSQSRESAESLLGFLTSWLTCHILDDDQAMARQLRDPSAAPGLVGAVAPADSADGRANAVLLAAMRQLHHALADANANLEGQIRARTRDLVQAEKMAAIGQLAAGVAHEINNPIAFVTANVRMLSSYATTLLSIADASSAYFASHPGEANSVESALGNAELPFLRRDLVELLAETREGLHRVKIIVAALRDFALENSGEATEVNLLDCLESTLIVAARRFKGKVKLVRELIPLPPVRGVSGQINQVFMNLIVNATEAIPAGGTIALRSGSDADGVWVEIADSGCGIPEPDMHRLFEPFFTTRPVGSGVGLGLSVAWDIVVKNHAGRIDVRSKPNVGSSFTVWLPRSLVATTVAAPTRVAGDLVQEQCHSQRSAVTGRHEFSYSRSQVVFEKAPGRDEMPILPSPSLVP